jgi:small subunit ribosomal protein S9
MAVQYFEGVGRRKESTARVRLMTGTGNVIVNNKSIETYFTRLGDPEEILAPLEAAGQDRTSLISRLWSMVVGLPGRPMRLSWVWRGL